MLMALLADSHFGARGDSLFFQDYFAKFYHNVFFPTLEKRGIKTIFHFGDFVDRRKFINFNILNRIKQDFVIPCIKQNIDVHIIPGNHDTTFKNTNDINAITELFSNESRFKIYTDPTELLFDKLKVLALPWINIENQEKTMNLIKNTAAKVVFGHLELSGFYMYRGVKNNEGLDKTIFKDFKQVLTGHYHTRSDDGKIFYLGTPYEMTFADLRDPKGFHIYDTDNIKHMEFIQNPYRMFHKTYYDDKGKTLEEIFQNKKFEKLEGTYVKVIVVNKTNPFFFDKFLEKIYSVQPANISIIEDLSVDSESDENVDMAEDTLTILNKYVDGMELDLNKDKIKNYLRQLYLEAINMESTDNYGEE